MPTNTAAPPKHHSMVPPCSAALKTAIVLARNIIAIARLTSTPWAECIKSIMDAPTARTLNIDDRRHLAYYLKGRQHAEQDAQTDWVKYPVI